MINLEKTTPYEIIGNLDLRKIADDELDAIIDGFCKEREKRKVAQEKADWEKLVEHLKTYIDLYGDIRIQDDVWISEDNNFNTPGEIW